MLCLVSGSGPGALTLSPYFQMCGRGPAGLYRTVLLRRRQVGGLGRNGPPAPQMPDAPLEAGLLGAAEGDLESQGRRGLGLPIGPFSPTPTPHGTLGPRQRGLGPTLSRTTGLGPSLL